MLFYRYVHAAATVVELHKRFYKLYDRLTKHEGSTFNLHAFSHTPLLRRYGDIRNVSAFPFESAYAVLRRSYVGGTPNTGLQAFHNMYSSYMYRHHCDRYMSYEAHTTTKRDNSICVVDGSFVKITRDLKGDDEGLHEGTDIAVEPYVSPADGSVDFALVGMFQHKGWNTSHVMKTFRTADIECKLVICGDNISLAYDRDLLE